MNKPTWANVLLTKTIAESKLDITEILKQAQSVWESMPDVGNDGSNDKCFFTIEVNSQKLFVVYSEAYSPDTHVTSETESEHYTIMFPEDY